MHDTMSPHPCHQGVLWIQSNRDDEIGTQTKTQKNPWGLKQDQKKKSPKPKLHIFSILQP